MFLFSSNNVVWRAAASLSPLLKNFRILRYRAVLPRRASAAPNSSLRPRCRKTIKVHFYNHLIHSSLSPPDRRTAFIRNTMRHIAVRQPPFVFFRRKHLPPYQRRLFAVADRAPVIIPSTIEPPIYTDDDACVIDWDAGADAGDGSKCIDDDAK